jgi:leucyl aminopeptidase (aminopeptidase T)
MELKSGIEPTQTHYSFEVMRGATVLVRDVMLAKPGESVLITCDSSGDRRVAEAIAEAAFTVGASPVLLYYPTPLKTFASEMVAPMSAAAASADIWIELAYATVMHSESWRKAMAAGCRYINLTGMDAQMMVNCITNIDYDLVVDLGKHLVEALGAADKVEIRSAAGTNLVAYNRGRKIRLSGEKATKKGYPIMMGGQISWCPIEETINGVIVFDGAVFPPAQLGLLRAPIRIEFKDGAAVGITGGREADIFRSWMASFNDPNMYRLAHYSLGFNPGVRAPTGRIVEDERVFGCIEFGLGSQGASIMGKGWAAASHTDGVTLGPTIILDGAVFEEDGVYREPKTREFCKRMGVQGY